MAYFIVIGTDNNVQDVVDEITNSHLQHNVVTSGCIISDDQNSYYHWDVYNEKGDKTQENNEPIVLHNALTNQISQFKTLLPDGAIPNVFIVSRCFNEEESETLQMVCEELYQIGGAKLSGLLVDIVLLGYDLKKSEDVTIRPHWRILESLRGLGVASRFHTNILYINNMDYMGAATNVDAHVLAKFLCHWSKMVCSGGYDPKATVHSNVYSIGMSEHQYDFRDLNGFFKLSAEERLLDRTLNNEPSADTKELLDQNYYKKIDLNLHWLDGLRSIQSIWNSYCSLEWNPAKQLSANPYSVSRHEQELASYLNYYLKLYIQEENREIAHLNSEIEQKESEIVELEVALAAYVLLPEDDLTKGGLISTTTDHISELRDDIVRCQEQIKIHEENVKNNTFITADDFHEKFGIVEIITEEDEANYSTNHEGVGRLVDYVKSDSGIAIMREAIERATVDDVLPQPYPASAVLNLGRASQIEISPDQVPSLPVESATISEIDELAERSGCLMWFKGLFSKKDIETASDIPLIESLTSRPSSITLEANKFLHDTLNNSVAALKKADDVRLWWRNLCEMIDKYHTRMSECSLLMDGDKNPNLGYANTNEGYRPQWHQKSISLIDMERVRAYRDTDAYYKQMIERFLGRWFDKNEDSNKRMTMPELIKHQVLDPLVGRFHTLNWDGSNPFVNEEITDEMMHEYIEHDIRQSKPFIEYVRLQKSNIVSNLNIGFFSNNPNIPTESTVFRNRYHIGTESINPVYLKDFVNSLCVIQVMDIPGHIDALKDYKPQRDAELNRLRSDIKSEVANIVVDSNTIDEKARAIYDWICDNIAYDTTKQIHDAETCWNTRRGVCQAYCELFCYMAEAVGLTADIITGKTKNHEGKISSDKHAWIFVYTKAYDGILIDPTWGAGAIDEMKFVKSDDNSTWFNVSPYWMIYSHFPDKPYWTKLEIQITEDQFKKLPYTNPIDGNDGKNYLFESISKI